MNHGRFSPDEPETCWLTQKNPPDRKMSLIREFWFDDPKKKRWSVPNGYVIDGASIPRALWTLVGSPYTGNYRRTSIVHDKACDDAAGDQGARRIADKMFYHACREGGCSVREAILLYIGVRIGAVWPSIAARLKTESLDQAHPYRTAEEQRIEADFRLIAEQVLQLGETDNPDKLEARTDKAMRRVLAAELPT